MRIAFALAVGAGLTLLGAGLAAAQTPPNGLTVCGVYSPDLYNAQLRAFNTANAAQVYRHAYQLDVDDPAASYSETEYNYRQWRQLEAAYRADRAQAATMFANANTIFCHK